jgi:hypothetical protein
VRTLPWGDVPIQAIVVRCTEQIVDVDVQISLGGAGFELLGNVGSTPLVEDALFPPALQRCMGRHGPRHVSAEPW